jgi:hypothetical protein
VSAGWVRPSSRGLRGGDALLLSTNPRGSREGVRSTAHPHTSSTHYHEYSSNPFHQDANTTHSSSLPTHSNPPAEHVADGTGTGTNVKVNTSAIPPLVLPVVLAVAFVAGSRWLLHALEPRRGAGLFEDVKRAMNDPESPVRPPPGQPSLNLLIRWFSDSSRSREP